MAITDGIDGLARQQPARLRPAKAAPKAIAAGTAGPFEPPTPRPTGSGLGDALLTGLLVVYPTFATVAAIVVGLALSGGGA